MLLPLPYSRWANVVSIFCVGAIKLGGFIICILNEIDSIAEFT
jgi:hypothetical protein